MSRDLTIVTATYEDYRPPIVSIRESVFQKEQGVSSELEFDGLDDDCTHLLAYLDNIPVGTSRIRYLTPETAKIERLAVLKSARGLGIGRELMLKAIDIIERNPDIKEIVVNAQVYVRELYEKLGFAVVGEPFEEAGIPHLKMILTLR